MGWIVLALLSLLTSLIALITALRSHRRIRRLEQVRSHSGPSPAGPADSFHNVELSLEAMLAELESKGQEMIKQMEAAAATPMTATTIEGARAAAEPAPSQKTSFSEAEQKKRTVRRLAAEGLDVEAIAQRLGLGKGEIQLILDLPDT